MNRWVQRGLRTALLTGGLLAAGAGVAAADENDLTADLLGVTTTVPVQDGTVLGTPVVTGTGEDLTVGSGAGDGLQLPVDTNTAPGTALLGDGGVDLPVRVTEADDGPPDPADGPTLTVPVATSGGGTAGTTVTVPIVTGDLGDVLDGDPLTGDVIDVDLADPVVPGQDGTGLLLDLEDTVTIGSSDGATSPAPGLELPVGLDADRPTTVALPLPGGPGSGGPLSGEDVDVTVGGLVGDGRPGTEQPTAGEPVLGLPISTGDLLPGLLAGDALSADTVDVDLGGLLGGAAGSGSVVEVPVDEGGTGTGSDLVVRITLPIDLAGLLGAGAPGTGHGGSDDGGSDDGAGNTPPGEGGPGTGGTATGHPGPALGGVDTGTGTGGDSGAAAASPSPPGATPTAAAPTPAPRRPPPAAGATAGRRGVPR